MMFSSDDMSSEDEEVSWAYYPQTVLFPSFNTLYTLQYSF